MPLFVLFILFRLCYLHAWPCLIWPKSHHSFCYPNICAILQQWHGHFVYSICTCLNDVYIIRLANYLSLSFELWELMVDGKKSVLSRILAISSLPHSREFKRLSTSLFLLSLQSSEVRLWNSVTIIRAILEALLCHYQQLPVRVFKQKSAQWFSFVHLNCVSYIKFGPPILNDV